MLNNWKVKFLSQAGEEILLKAVFQAIPTNCIMQRAKWVDAEIMVGLHGK
jgi:hypothetical protein